MGRYDFEGSYKGHIWENIESELGFAFSDLAYAYEKLLKGPTTISDMSENKRDMDNAMDRVGRIIRQAQKEIGG